MPNFNCFTNVGLDCLLGRKQNYYQFVIESNQGYQIKIKVFLKIYLVDFEISDGPYLPKQIKSIKVIII